jgi:hypothetical protein
MKFYGAIRIPFSKPQSAPKRNLKIAVPNQGKASFGTFTAMNQKNPRVVPTYATMENAFAKQYQFKL